METKDFVDLIIYIMEKKNFVELVTKARGWDNIRSKDLVCPEEKPEFKDIIVVNDENIFFIYKKTDQLLRLNTKNNTVIAVGDFTFDALTLGGNDLIGISNAAKCKVKFPSVNEILEIEDSEAITVIIYYEIYWE